MVKLFPSQYFFDSETEAQYVEWIFSKAKFFVGATIAVVVLFIITITTVDIITVGFDVVLSRVFALRVTILVVSILAFVIFLWISSLKAQLYLFITNLIMAVLVSMDTYFWVGEVRCFSEGAQMMTMIIFMIVPLINVEHKLITGMVIIIGIIICHLLLNVDVFWTLFYVFMVYGINLVVYYKFDLLLRIQFKIICEERFNANIDQLTKVYNRNALSKYFQDDINNLTEGKELMIGILDIDCFKLYNDTYGHLAGDKILKQIAQALQGCGFDRVYRFGGEEFIFTVVREADDKWGIPDVCAILKNLKIAHKASLVDKYLTASVGVISLECNKVNFFTLRKVAPDSLIKAADINLYKAKGQGRNRMISSEFSV